ncbi:hypothetical protein EON65_49015 [archaeon]|nr:MAG: hypothetical protein EON65_49015 [archaeon]
MIEESEKHAEQLAQQKEFELRGEVWKDVQAYREKMREEARRSLAFRLAEKHRLKEIDMTEHDQKMRSIHLDLLCRREDCMAIREHKIEEEARRRKSISMRLQHWKEVKMQEAKLKEKEEMMKEEEARLREMDREDLLAAKLTYQMMEKRSVLDSSLIL